MLQQRNQYKHKNQNVSQKLRFVRPVGSKVRGNNVPESTVKLAQFPIVRVPQEDD